MSAAVVMPADVVVPSAALSKATREIRQGYREEDGWGQIGHHEGDPLLGSDIAVVRERTRHVEPALGTASRLYASVQDLRVRCRAYRNDTIRSLWSYARSFLGSRSGENAQGTSERKKEIEADISRELGELKKIVENVIVPSLVPVREALRGRTFDKTSETPKSLLYVSVPTAKVGKVLSFDSLRDVIKARVEKSPVTEIVLNEEGRVILNRTFKGAGQSLEFSYQRPGKVDVYVDGIRRGSMWTDDAYQLAKAFSAGRDIPLKRQQRFTEYTVW